MQDIDDDDYGEYKCVAANALGRDMESMYLYSKWISLINTLYLFQIIPFLTWKLKESRVCSICQISFT